MDISRPLSRRGGRTFAFWFAVLVVVTLDQAVKAAVRARLAVGEVAPLLPGVLRLEHVENTGAAFSMGEGAGVVVLETLEHAQKRGAKICAEIVGYGINSDAYHITSPAPHGEYQAKCMRLALADAEMRPEDIDYINAHGTSTHMNDLCETEAIKTVWGTAAKDVSVSSVKSMTGHLLGAAGSVELIATVLAVENDMLPPTINYETPDEGLDLDYVPNVARAKTVRAAISNSFGFGGHNACLVVKKIEK